MTKDELTKLGVPPELHEDATLKEIKDVPTALKVLVDTKAFVGNSIRIPTKDAGEAALKEFREKLKEKIPTLVDIPSDDAEFAKVEDSLYERLGKPKEVKGYPSLTDLKIQVPEGVKLDEDELRAEALALGLTKRQFAAMAAKVVERTTKAVQANSENRKALRTELGEAFEERLLAAAATAKKLGEPEDVVNGIKTGTVDPATARRWINVAKAMGTEPNDLGADGGGSGKLTPAEAEAQIAELFSNPDYLSGKRPDLVAKMVKLHEIAYPGAA